MNSAAAHLRIGELAGCAGVTVRTVRWYCDQGLLSHLHRLRLVAVRRHLAELDTLELLAKAPDPASAARLTITQISAALRRARRRDVAGKAQRIQAALREQHLGQSEVVTEAYAASVTAASAVIAVLNEQIKTMEARVESLFAATLMPGSTSASPASG
jgi:DNA-binding transcriptional MerR regulator